MIIMRIKDLEVATILGVYDWERAEKRPVLLNIELYVSCDNAGKSDELKDAVDYAVLEQKVVEHLSSSSYNLLEKLVYSVGELLLSLDKRIAKVIVEADKIGALKQARSVSVSAELVGYVAVK